jgi:enoyl-CoA hydratase/carnithine racemase
MGTATPLVAVTTEGSSRRIDADEAYRIGFVDRLVDDDSLVDEVERRAPRWTGN